MVAVCNIRTMKEVQPQKENRYRKVRIKVPMHPLLNLRTGTYVRIELERCLHIFFLELQKLHTY